MIVTAAGCTPNELNRLLVRLEKLPGWLGIRLFDAIFGRFTPFYRTMRVRSVELMPGRVSLALRNRRRIRNHVRGIHAVAAMLPAEYAAGLVVGQAVPADAVVVVKGVHIDIRKPIRGAVKATAALSAEALNDLRFVPKGSIEVPVTVWDETGETPMTGVVNMAWFPKN